MKNKSIPIILLILAIIEIVAVTLGTKTGSININKNFYWFLIIVGVLVIIMVLYTIIKFAIIPKIKYKKVFKLLKNQKYNELLQTLKTMTFTSKNSDQFTILSVISNETIFYDDLFFNLVKNLNSKDYIFAHHFWLALKYFSLKNYNEFSNYANLYYTSPKSFINSSIYYKIIKYLTSINNDDENIQLYNYLNKKIKNIVISDLIKFKYNELQTKNNI